MLNARDDDLARGVAAWLRRKADIARRAAAGELNREQLAWLEGEAAAYADAATMVDALTARAGYFLVDREGHPVGR